MQSTMFFFLHKLQVFEAIIVSDAVDVMYHFVRLKQSTYLAFHDERMFHHMAVFACVRMIWGVDRDISVRPFLFMPTELVFMLAASFVFSATF